MRKKLLLMLALAAAGAAWGFGEVRVDVIAGNEINDPAAPEMRVSRLYVGKPLEKKTASFVSKPLTSQWKKLEFSFVPAQNGRASITFQIPGSSNKPMMKPVLVDGVSIVGATVVNGGFEEEKNGKPVGWTLGANAGYLTGESADGGNRCIQVKDTGCKAYQYFPVKAGEKVTVTFFAKLTEADAKALSAPPKIAKRVTAASGVEPVRYDGFSRSKLAWDTRKYWSGEVSWQDKEVILRATEKKGRIWGRADGTRLRPAVELAGRRFRITVAARGKGAFKVGFLVTTLKPNGKKLDYNYEFPEKPAELSDKVQNYTYEIDLGDITPLTISPTVEVEGENAEARMRSVRVDAVRNPGANMELLTPLAVVPEGTPAPARRFRFSKPDAAVRTFLVKAVRDKGLFRFDVAGDQPVIRPVVSDEKGAVTMRSDAPVNGLVKYTAAAEGATAVGYAVSLPAEKYQAMAELAKKVPTDKPMSVLVIGDSLNDFNRGYNAMDYLEFFLNLSKPGTYTVHNFAVAGDYITRVEDRLNGKRNDRRYNGIFDRKYDLVIIALGNNDCRALSSDNYATPLVKPDKAKASYERVIAALRKHSDVPVWLCSSSYSNYAQQVKRSDKAVKSGRLGVRFGIQEHLDNYNNMLKELAASGKDLRYIELCAPMKAAFSPDNYADGVHLSPKGHQIFAELLLRAFAK